MESDVKTLEKTSKLCSLMNIGKKILITGTLLSSAPVLLPPFLVISALGLAVSVPFGVMYASYACTDSIMSKLLPPIQMTQEEEEEDGGGLVSVIDDGKEEEPRQEEVIVSIDTAQNLPVVQSDDVGKKGLGELLEMKSEKVVEIKEKKRLSVVKGIVRRRKKRKEGEGEEKKEKKEEELHKQTETSVPEKASLQEESSRVSHEKEPVTGNAVPPVETRTEPRVSKDEEDQTIVDVITETKLKTEEVDDKTIWDKIDAIRAIIGFQSPRRPSYFEELQALYLCAGIEPPSSSPAGEEAHADFEKKLGFLMSVIGLK